MGIKELAETVCSARNGVFGYVPNKLYKASLIKENGICFREDMAAQEDMEFALSAFQKGKNFCLFDYCGYIYDYAPSKRQAPLKALIGNQQKLLRLAENSEAGEAYRACVTGKISDLTYTVLFHCRGVEEIKEIAAFPGLKEDIKNSIPLGEKNLTL